MATTSTLLSRGLGLVLVEFKYEYKDRDGTLVSIKPNERYVLLAKTNDHWWQVRHDHTSKSFYVPANYVKELPDVPSPLDFTDQPSHEPALLSVVAPTPTPTPTPVPVPVPVPVPKTLDEPAGTRTKPGDEVTIRLRPEGKAGYRKTENRMSTFGVPLDFHEQGLLEVTPQRHPNMPAGETRLPSGSTKADSALNKIPLLANQDKSWDSGKTRVPSFSPADPLRKPSIQTQPIAVETPVAPTQSNLQTAPDCQDNQEEEEEALEEESSETGSGVAEEIEPDKEEESSHIYESIQDLNIDVDALVQNRESTADPPKPPSDSSLQKNATSVGLVSPVYANISSLKKSSISPASDLTPLAPNSTPSNSDCSPFSSVSSPVVTTPDSPVSPVDGWQVHIDQGSGKQFYYHPITRQTTWSDPRASQSDSVLDPSGGPTSPSSFQGVCGWKQLVDEVSGKFYYYNPTSGATSWVAPESLPPSSPSGSTSPRIPDDGPPPLPVEDYPIDTSSEDTVFTVPPVLPSRIMGNGVQEERPSQQVRAWRHSIAEDTLASSHRRNFSDVTEVTSKMAESHQGSPLEKAGILNKTKVSDHGKKIRKNWGQSWTVLHGGILTFYRDPKSASAAVTTKTSQIVPEFTVDLRGASVNWASKDKSSKKNVLELKTRQGCEYLMQYDTDSIINDWLKVVQGTIIKLNLDHLTDDEDEGSDKEDKDHRRTVSRTSSAVDSEQRRVRTKLRRFLQRRPTLQSVKEKGYIQDNVFGCYLDTLCQRENSTVPRFMEKCIRAVERRGLDVDGIYRVSGNLAVIQKLRHKADHEEQLDLEDGQWQEIHVITGALKLFLRELPEPLFPFSAFDKFIAAIQIPDFNTRVSYMKDLVASLPLPNHDTMEMLFRHLCRVVEHKESNRMSVQSLAIVFGPTLLSPQTESANMAVHMVFQSQIVELMLNQFENIFSQRNLH